MRKSLDLKNISELKKEWEKIKFPVKPSQEHLALYEKIIVQMHSNNEKPKIVLLGSNPDIRDLCLKHNCYITAICNNETTLSLTNRFMKYQNHPQEKNFVGNWKKLTLRSNLYDLVIADITFAVSPFEDYQPILKEIKRVLKPDGLCAIRKGSLPDNYKPLGAPRIIKQWRKKEISLHDFVFHAYLMSLDKSNYFYGIKSFDIFQQMHNQGNLTTDELETLKPYCGNIKISCPYQKDLVKMFSNFFEIISTQSPQGFDLGKIFPIYLMSAKK